ncbi:MAG: flagellin [Sporomusaceae bacterium]|nr:flagellin [Sporomusaceae bacterium]
MNINSSLNSMGALNNLSKSIFNANLAMLKIATGQRINKAGDDAAGLAISERMSALTRGYNAAARNAEDGSSVIQVADGALNATQSGLQRMRELAVQASNDTLSDSDRSIIQNEYNAISQELDRSAAQTEFNTQKLLDGSFTNKTLHLGANSDENMTVSISDMSSSGLGLTGTDLSTRAGANSALEQIDAAIEQVSTVRGELGAIDNRLGYSYNNLQVASINTTAAESRIRDSVTSKEIMNQTTQSLLMQSSLAMLAQSNKNASNILFLLGGR